MTEYPDFHGDMPIYSASIKQKKEGCQCGTNCLCAEGCECETCGCQTCSPNSSCDCGSSCNCDSK